MSNTTVLQKVSTIQMVSGPDVQANLDAAAKLLAEAKRQGAVLAVLPENFALFDAQGQRALAEAEAEGRGPVHPFLQQQARDLGLWIVAGSVPEVTRPDGSRLESRVRACCRVYDDQGEVVGRYDKIHLFDVDVDDAHGSYRESATIEPGDTPVVVDTPVGRLGLAICYDLRFPELFRHYRDLGATLVSVPAAFTWRTGEAHWEVLLRARAIEQQLWLIAPGQGGTHSPSRQTWGHSCIIDPWGTVLAVTETGEGVATAAIDPEVQTDIRRAMPLASHRRL